MDGKIWGYGAGFARPIPPISFLFRRFPENQNLPFVPGGEICLPVYLFPCISYALCPFESSLKLVTFSLVTSTV